MLEYCINSHTRPNEFFKQIMFWIGNDFPMYNIPILNFGILCFKIILSKYEVLLKFLNSKNNKNKSIKGTT
jgi:hypothetical protein